MDQDIHEFGHEVTEDMVAEAPVAAVHMRAKPDGVLDPAGEAGWFLEREREARGQSLEQAGDQVGIHPYHLDAIELGDMTRMPPRMEALGMIAAYAQYLGFEPEPLVAHYLKFLPKPGLAPKAAHPANPQPLSSAKVLSFGRIQRLPSLNFRFPHMPGGAGGAVATIAGAIMLFAGTSWLMKPAAQGPEVAQVVQHNADGTATSSNNDATVTVRNEAMPDDGGAAPNPADQPVVAEDTGGTPAGPDDALGQFIARQMAGNDAKVKTPKTAAAKPAAIPQPKATADEVASTTPAPPASGDGHVFGDTSAPARLVLKAKAPVWLRVEDGQGNVVMTQMLMKGDTYRVPDREGLVAIARDGGLLAYVVDGVEKGVLGPPGEILVGRSLDVKTLDVKG